VAALQRDLGVPLVAREGRGLELTPAGRVFAGYARQVLGLLDEARVAAAGQLSPERGRVRLAAVTTAGEHVLPPYLAAFRTRCPEAEVTLEVGNRSRVWELLGYREVDLVIGRYATSPPGPTAWWWWRRPSLRRTVLSALAPTSWDSAPKERGGAPMTRFR
jgi:DNA-binding transcriptional LysR family regulator